MPIRPVVSAACTVALVLALGAVPGLRAADVPAMLLSPPMGGDCNDLDPNVHPGQPEIPFNRIDDDCDGLADEDEAGNPPADFVDLDGDGVSLADGDCNDTDPAVHPGATEIVGNSIDDDCDGLADEAPDGTPSDDLSDIDGDGYTIGLDPFVFASGFEAGES